MIRPKLIIKKFLVQGSLQSRSLNRWYIRNFTYKAKVSFRRSLNLAAMDTADIALPLLFFWNFNWTTDTSWRLYLWSSLWTFSILTAHFLLKLERLFNQVRINTQVISVGRGRKFYFLIFDGIKASCSDMRGCKLVGIWCFKVRLNMMLFLCLIIVLTNFIFYSYIKFMLADFIRMIKTGYYWFSRFGELLDLFFTTDWWAVTLLLFELRNPFRTQRVLFSATKIKSNSLR